MVIRKPTLIYLVIILKQLPDDRHTQCYMGVNWDSVEMLDLKRCREEIVLNDMHLFFVKPMLNSWAIRTEFFHKTGKI